MGSCFASASTIVGTRVVFFALCGWNGFHSHRLLVFRTWNQFMRPQPPQAEQNDCSLERRCVGRHGTRGVASFGLPTGMPSLTRLRRSMISALAFLKITSFISPGSQPCP